MPKLEEEGKKVFFTVEFRVGRSEGKKNKDYPNKNFLAVPYGVHTHTTSLLLATFLSCFVGPYSFRN